MSTPPPLSWVARAPNVLERRCGDVVLLLQRGTGELRRLEGAAAATWLVASEPIRVGELLDGAVSASGPDADRAAVVSHVTSALDALCQAGVLTVGAPHAPPPTGGG